MSDAGWQVMLEQWAEGPRTRTVRVWHQAWEDFIQGDPATPPNAFERLMVSQCGVDWRDAHS
eukprot:scaffold4635_cov267-Pinguiococcus_pyrenoidosus.AAC.11